LNNETKLRFITSYYGSATSDLDTETTCVAAQLTEVDLDSPLDLRTFYDPAPLTVGCLSPLTIVYRLFNEIGVRHIPVLDDEQSLVGIITRQDVQPETISARLSAVEVCDWATEMHDYWRSVLFGPSNDTTSGTARTSQRRLSCPCGGMPSASPTRRSLRRSLQTSSYRRGSSDRRMSGNCDMLRRVAPTRKQSLAFLRMSTQMRLPVGRNSTVGLPTRSSVGMPTRCSASLPAVESEGSEPSLAPLESERASGERASSPSGSEPNSAADQGESGVRQCQGVTKASLLDLEAHEALVIAAAEGKPGSVEHTTRLLAKSLNLSPAVLQSQGSSCRASALNQGLSNQPSLAGSLRAAAVRRFRESRLAVTSTASPRASPGNLRAMGLSPHGCRFPSSLRNVERRVSAPATLLSTDFRCVQVITPT